MKMNIKTNLLEEYVNYVDSTRKQNTCFKIIIFLFANIILFVFFSNIIQSSICTIVLISLILFV